ncbi:UNVERIFIED_ORG: hypothetical protein FHR35_004896 [Microbispora rosea subsp. rosea]
MTEDFSSAFEDLRPRSWLDAFPWIKGASAETSPWWTESIDDASSPMRRQRLAHISELAMERLSHWTIGQIFPGLPPELDLLTLPLPGRAANALVREQFTTGADLMSLTIASIMGWRQVGVGTVDAILQALADASTSAATPTVTTGHAPSKVVAPVPDDVRLPDWTSSLIGDLSQIAGWYTVIGLPDQLVLGAPLPPGTPDEIVKARHRLEELRVSDVLPAGDSATDVAALFDEALASLDSRAGRILSDRLFADNPLTLDQIGLVHGVTRERIRQIEGKARGAMLEFISDGGALAMVADAARTLIGTIRPLEELLTLMPALARTVESVGQPAWRVLDRLDDTYEIEDGWAVVPTMSAAKALTQTQLQEQADQYGVVRLDNLDLVETYRPDQRTALTATWLAHCGYVVQGDHVLTRTQSVGEYGAAILSIAGSPLSSQEIVDRFVFERSVGSLRNAMSSDDRFERVDRDRWALSEWGMEAYSGLRSMIREQVAASGGRVQLDDLIEYITSRYSVTASSVVAYASAAPFHAKDGYVTLASASREIRKSPERTRRLFRQPDGWAYRVRITKDHLRGSGSVAPVAIASILDMQSGETRHLASRLGDQVIAWTGIQPSFGTIRRFLMDQDIAADTEAFLVIKDNATFAFEPAREMTGNPLQDALSLIGAPLTTDRDKARVAFAKAIGLPGTSPVTSIIGGYRERGDDDLADLLTSVRDYLATGVEPGHPVPDTAVDEILDLL